MGIYALLLVMSHASRRIQPKNPPPAREGVHRIRVYDAQLADSVLVVLEDFAPRDDPRPVVVLMHGSPGDRSNFRSMLAQADDSLRWIAVDLPGFGEARSPVADLSFATHARAVSTALARRGVASAHWLGFSMGGAVALSIADAEPERVRSLIFLGSIGVQELELLGDYHLNHLLHGVQLAAVWLLSEAVPHFGLFDGGGLDLSFARNFYDSDQRPLRGMLERLEAPLLILHGDHDPLVPFAAAREHHRIVPQSRLIQYDDSHFLPWSRPAALVAAIEDWVRELESGRVPTRSSAAPERIAAARVPFDRTHFPRADGLVLFTLLALLVVGTFVAEDLTCLSAGLLVAQGRLDFATALTACAGGIYFGDLLLYALGRWFSGGRRRPRVLRWFLREDELADARSWFARRGLWVILVTRFLPGTRLPTYVAAGMLRTPFLRFAAYFLLAVLIWTPLIVALSMFVGRAAFEQLESWRHAGWWLLLGLALLIAVATRLLPSVLTRRGRRGWSARWQRVRRWEFWPAWAVYLPLGFDFVRLSMRHGGFHTVTAVNPGIEGGGFVGESKSAILDGLGAGHPAVAHFVRLEAGGSLEARLEVLAAAGLAPPVVIKPDIGERGRGVQIIRSASALRQRLQHDGDALMAQEYVPGLEFGIFYMRDPRETSGRLFSVARKLLPEVVGDGRRSLWDLVLDDERAHILASEYLRQAQESALAVPAAGERVLLTELGTHCRGAIFVDANHLATAELLGSIDEIVSDFEGFAFGRFDLRVASEADLIAGKRLKILELNGLTSEPAHIYDPRYSIFDAWKVLREQWERAFTIAAEQRRRGARPKSVRWLVRAALQHRLRASS